MSFESATLHLYKCAMYMLLKTIIILCLEAITATFKGFSYISKGLNDIW